MLRLTNRSTKHVLFGYKLSPGFGARSGAGRAAGQRRIVHQDVTGVVASCIRSIPVKIFFSRSTHSSVSISVFYLFGKHKCVFI